MALTIQNLIENLKRNKDAVVIVGDKVVEELNLYKIDENSKKDFNKKKMVKEPQKFWEFYKQNIANHKLTSQAGIQLSELMDKDVIKTVVNLNYNGEILCPLGCKIQVINLKGTSKDARCMSCDKSYLINETILNTDKLLKCECGGKITPSIVMFGEKYLEKHTKAIKEAIFKETDNEVKLNTHCLIFIGVDFEEDYMHELIESYNAIKAQVNTEEDEYYLVIISEKDGVSIEYYQPEFATYENISESIIRLKDML